MSLHINGPQSGELSAAIESAFPSPMILQQVIGFKLDDNIFNYAGFAAQYPEIRFQLILQYNARYQIDKLVHALLEQNPTNAELLKFAWKHQILARPSGSNNSYSPEDDSLERMLDPVRGFIDPMAFLRRFGQITKCVCRVSVPSDAGIEYGTGFLIGDETVITNYHVMKAVIEKAPGASRSKVRFLFDYHTGPDGQTISSGVEYRLIDDDSGWLIDSSPYHSVDTVVRQLADNLAIDRPADHLDYAVLRLADKPGTNRLGQKPTTDGEVRGHLVLPNDSEERFKDDFNVGKSAVFIFQHPSKQPLLLDLGVVLGVNGNRTRALYAVNTQHGSSGSPCFNTKLELIALHHAGGKDWPAGVEYLYNQGIPIGRIRDRMAMTGSLSQIQ
jgi:hypothetical protein